jgi:uncharacterized protein YceK
MVPEVTRAVGGAAEALALTAVAATGKGEHIVTSEAIVGIRPSTGIRWSAVEVAMPRIVLVVALAMALVLAGCATIRSGEARSTEQLLVGAGFRADRAETALADLRALPALKLVPRTRDGELLYVYADPHHCRCLFVGGPAEHSEYERLAAQRERAREQRAAARYWEMWDPWRWSR